MTSTPFRVFIVVDWQSVEVPVQHVAQQLRRDELPMVRWVLSIADSSCVVCYPSVYTSHKIQDTTEIVDFRPLREIVS